MLMIILLGGKFHYWNINLIWRKWCKNDSDRRCKKRYFNRGNEACG